MDLHTQGALIHGRKFVLGLGWTYTHTGALILAGKFVFGLGWTYSTHTGPFIRGEVCLWFRMDLHTGGHLFMERSLY